MDLKLRQVARRKRRRRRKAPPAPGARQTSNNKPVPLLSRLRKRRLRNKVDRKRCQNRSNNRNSKLVVKSLSREIISSNSIGNK